MAHDHPPSIPTANLGRIFQVPDDAVRVLVDLRDHFGCQLLLVDQELLIPLPVVPVDLASSAVQPGFKLPSQSSSRRQKNAAPFLDFNGEVLGLIVRDTSGQGPEHRNRLTNCLSREDPGAVDQLMPNPPAKIRQVTCHRTPSSPVG